MSTPITWPTINGVSFSIPASGEFNWADLSNYLIALASAQTTTVQKLGVRIATTSPVLLVSDSDCVVETDLTVPGPVDVNLPAGVQGQLFIIKDRKGDAGTNNITITPNGSETIDGASSALINVNYGSLELIFLSGTWSATYSGVAGGALVLADGKIYVGNASNQAIAVTPTGDVTFSNTGVTTIGSGKVTSGMIADGTIVNADVNTSAAIAYSKLNLALSLVNGDISASAAIAYSKLAAMTSANILLGNGSNVATVTPVTGDVTISAAGVTAIGSGKVTSGMILDGTIVNADINAAAAIDGTKISPIFGTQAITNTNTTDSTTTGTGAIVTSGGIGVAKKITAGDTVGTPGIKFPSTQVSSADPNTLDDYKESTWTPVFTGSTGSIGATAYTTQGGTYTKIGNRVFINCNIVLSNKGSWTGLVSITGLPYPSKANTPNQYGAISVAAFSGMTSSLTFLSGYVNPNASTINFHKLTAAATATTDLAVADVSNTFNIQFSATYETA